MTEESKLKDAAKSAYIKVYHASKAGDIDLAAHHWLEFEVCARKLTAERVKGKIAALKLRK